MTETHQLLTIAVALAPIASGLTALAKRYTPAEGKVLPAISVLAGVLLGVIWSGVFGHIDELPVYALAGMISGLSAGGFYNLVEPNKEGK